MIVISASVAHDLTSIIDRKQGGGVSFYEFLVQKLADYVISAVVFSCHVFIKSSTWLNENLGFTAFPN